jgi:hypothetical protein
MPDVSSELNKVNEEIAETLHSTKITTDESLIPVGAKTPAGEEILKEVTSFVENRLVEALPEPPIASEIPEFEKTTLKEMVALAANCSQAIGGEVEDSGENSSQTLFSFKKAEIQQISLKVENEKPCLEDVVLEYVKKSKGEIDLARCSADLETSYDQVEKALESLGAKGKIRIELKAGE